MKLFIGKNPDFSVEWDCSRQTYTVFRNNKSLGIVKYKFSQVETYLN